MSSDSAAQPESNPLSPAWMFVLALLVGVFGGVGSILFRGAIGFVQQLFFYGEIGFQLTPEIHLPPSTWGWAVIFVPVAGAVLVTWITNTLAPEVRGGGVPEVMDAIHYRGGRIRPITVLAKAAASAISIGSGGSVGREGPIIQIGSAFGSTLGQIWRMPARQRVVLVGAGAAAAIAATFNAPLGGLAFAMELLLVSVSAQNVALVASATITATYIGQLHAGIGPTFEIPGVRLFGDHGIGGRELLLCVPFGVLTGVAAAVFVRSIYWFEDRFDAAIGNSYLRHMTGMLIVGIMIYAFLRYTGEYYVAGVGYATIIDVMFGVLTDPWFLLLLFAAKLLATSLTLGSGASGGVFSPTLFLGATLGAAYADGLAALAPALAVDPLVFALAGMAGMVGATTSAVVTAIVMVFEQTRDYAAILPIIMTVALAYVVRVQLTPESIYTLKLARRGHGIPQGLQAALSATLNARKVMSRDFEVVEVDRLQAWAELHRPGAGPRYTVVARDGEVIGLAREELPYLAADRDPESLIDRDFLRVARGTRWAALMRRIKARGCEVLFVGRTTRVEDLVGVITPREIARAACDNAELMD